MSSRRKIGLALILVFGALLIYLLAWPVGIEPVAFVPPEAPPLTGVYEPNNRLTGVERFAEGAGFGPENVAFDAEGRIYAGVEGGAIVRLDADGTNPERFATTPGRPLGMEFDAEGNLIVADSPAGLLSVAPDGSVTVLTDEAAGKPILFADDLDVSSDGTIYFSDGSVYPIDFDDPLLPFFDGRPHGRLLAYEPETRTTKVLLDGLHFANGVALSPDEAFVLVTETWGYRISRYWLSGPKKGQTDLFFENLPAKPDNISFNGRDTYWLALFEPRVPEQERLQANPFMRKLLMRLPRFMIPQSGYGRYGFVLGLDLDGRVVHNLQDPEGEHVFQVTSVEERDGMLYLGTLADDAIKRIPVP